jgi:hypothetical protein
MVNIQSKYLHLKVYCKFCLMIKDMHANCKTNTIQHNKKETKLIKETMGVQFSTFVVVIKVI